MKYFKECSTLDEVKSVYKKLAKQYHPDMGGDLATMQEINKEYQLAIAKLANGANLTDEEKEQHIRFSDEYRRVLEMIISLPDIQIELVGFWIWVTGNTKPVKDQLHSAGLHFAYKKQAWYFRGDQFKVLRGGKKTLEQIRSKYGSETINNQHRKSKILLNK
ncbi:DnaJ domain protein [compost metagenome]